MFNAVHIVYICVRQLLFTMMLVERSALSYEHCYRVSSLPNYSPNHTRTCWTLCLSTVYSRTAEYKFGHSSFHNGISYQQRSIDKVVA